MGFYSSFYESIFGGWRTWGPGSGLTPGAFASDPNGAPYQPVSKLQALRIAAYYACLRIRAETIASLPIQILDAKNNVLKDHPLYSILRVAPNKTQTGVEFFSATVANADMFGYAVAPISRYRTSKEVFKLEFVETDKVGVEESPRKRPIFVIDDERYTEDEVFITKAFGIDGSSGLAQLQVARNVLSGQTAANDAAATAFRNSLSFGGFLKLPSNSRAWKADQYDEFDSRMEAYGRAGNRAGKYMVLMPGMEPVSGQQFKMTAADAELLASRQFGIEEICRFMSVPPPLIGQTNKASSWASSLDALNQGFVTYGLQPTTTRIEARIQKQLFTDADRAAGLRVKFNLNGLLRGDVVKRLNYYKIMQGDLGNITANQVLALEDLPDIGPEGDVRRVMLNTGVAGTNDNTSTEKTGNENQND